MVSDSCQGGIICKRADQYISTKQYARKVLSSGSTSLIECIIVRGARGEYDELSEILSMHVCFTRCHKCVRIY